MPIHRSHPNHELSRLTPYTSLYTCDGCQMHGFGERYRCTHLLTCDYDLHKECMHPDETLTLDAFPGCTLKFLDRPPPIYVSTWCNMCGMNIKGFLYHNKEQRVDVHPRCAALPLKIPVGDGVVLELYNCVLAKCDCCESKELKGGALNNYSGFSYVSQCKKYSFHVYCLMELLIIHAATLSNMYSNSVNNNNNAAVGREVAIPDGRLQTNVNRSGGSTVKVFKLGKVCLKILWTMLTGDPTTIFTSALDVADLLS